MRFAYGPLSRLVQETQTHMAPGSDEQALATYSYRHTYDALSNRTDCWLPGGHHVQWLYYGSGHLHQINIAHPQLSVQPAGQPPRQAPDEPAQTVLPMSSCRASHLLSTTRAMSTKSWAMDPGTAIAWLARPHHDIDHSKTVYVNGRAIVPTGDKIWMIWKKP